MYIHILFVSVILLAHIRSVIFFKNVMVESKVTLFVLDKNTDLPIKISLLVTLGKPLVEIYNIDLRLLSSVNQQNKKYVAAYYQNGTSL